MLYSKNSQVCLILHIVFLTHSEEEIVATCRSKTRFGAGKGELKLDNLEGFSLGKRGEFTNTQLDMKANIYNETNQDKLCIFKSWHTLCCSSPMLCSESQPNLGALNNNNSIIISQNSACWLNLARESWLRVSHGRGCSHFVTHLLIIWSPR